MCFQCKKFLVVSTAARWMHLNNYKAMARINPRIDIAFKKLFGTEENKDLLISLINSMVKQEDQVVDVRLLNPCNLQRFRADKLSILDIKAEGACGKKLNIEIQITDPLYWAQSDTDCGIIRSCIMPHLIDYGGS